MSRAIVHFDDFDPNGGSQTMYGVWASDFAFKIYATRSPALNRFNSWPEAKLFEFVPADSKWVLRGHKTDSKPDTCTACGASTFDYPFRYDYDANTGVYNWVQDFTAPKENLGAFVWVRDRRGRHSEPMQMHFACDVCVKANGWK